jgi:hypothetical protein
LDGQLSSLPVYDRPATVILPSRLGDREIELPEIEMPFGSRECFGSPLSLKVEVLFPEDQSRLLLIFRGIELWSLCSGQSLEITSME